MASATESFRSRNQPFGFFPSKVRPKVAPRWAFQLDLALAGITIFSPLLGIAAPLDRRGWWHQELLVALSLLVFVTATVGCGLRQLLGRERPTARVRPWRRTVPCLFHALSGCRSVRWNLHRFGVPAHRWLVERFSLVEFDYADMTRRCALLSRMEATPLRMFSQPCSWHSRKRS